MFLEVRDMPRISEIYCLEVGHFPPKIRISTEHQVCIFAYMPESAGVAGLMGNGRFVIGLGSDHSDIIGERS